MQKNLINQTLLIITAFVLSWFFGVFLFSYFNFVIDSLFLDILWIYMLLVMIILLPILGVYFVRKETTPVLGKLFRGLTYTLMVPIILMALAEIIFEFFDPFFYDGFILAENIWNAVSSFYIVDYSSLIPILIYIIITFLLYWTARINKALKNTITE